MKLPIHQNPTQKDRTASAPYNFVPLPEVVVNAVENAGDLPDQDRFYNEPERYSGKIKVTLETSSPLYIRAPLTSEQFQYEQEGKYVDGEEIDNPKKPKFRRLVKNIPEFFYTDSETRKPVIPGSSLRGMLRSLLEIVSFGKIQWVTNEILFYRNVRDRHYRELFTSGSGQSGNGYRSNVEGGFWKKNHEGKFQIEKCKVARIEVGEIVKKFGLSSVHELYEGHGPNATPHWRFQHEEIWVKTEKAETDHRHSRAFLRYLKVDSIEKAQVPDHIRATLVLTGPMQRKHLAFAFIPMDNPDVFDVPSDADATDAHLKLADLFHSDEQITQWQASAFPQGKHKKTPRHTDGHLAEGEPVFYLRESGRLKFFGRAQLFRLPYDNSPLDMVPKEFRRPEGIDYAEALFGFVRTKDELDDMKARGLQVPQQGDKGYAYAGRVSVTDATVEDVASVEQLTENDGKAIVPAILATPKPTSYQHYLVQEHGDDERQLYHYNSKTVIRGFKRYWFKRERGPEDLCVKHPEESEWVDQNAKDLFESEKMNDRYLVKERSSQLTQFKPIKTNQNKHFTFYIHFENLREDELGALLWTLELPGPKKERYRHSLGMGKPFGMGAVKLTPTLLLTNRRDRYQHLFKDGNWDAGSSTPPDTKRFIEKFEHFVLNVAAPKKQKLQEVDRIGMLLNMLEWPGPEAERTRYLLIKRYDNVNEYSKRPVLPDPSAFGDPFEGAVSTAKAEFDPLPSRSSQERHSQQSQQPQTSSGQSTRHRNDHNPPSEVSPEARAILRAAERQQQQTEAAAQGAYTDGEVVKAKIIKNPDGTLGAILPKLKDQSFPMVPKRRYSQARAGAKIRVKVVVDKNNVITRTDEL